MNLAIIKLFISLAIVISLAEISKRTNPKTAGIIAGLPLGTGISIYFVTLEQGVQFTMRGLPWGIAGLSGSLLFCLVYLLVSKVQFTPLKIVKVISSSIAGIVVFLLIGYLFNGIRLNIMNASLLFVVFFLANLWLINKLVKGVNQSTPSRSTFKQVLGRGVVVGSVLLLITTISPWVGSKWANVLSSFPSTLFPLLLILHYEDENKRFPHVIHGFSTGIITLFVFYWSYRFFVPLLGLNMGYLMVYGVCGLYLFLLQLIKGRLKERLALRTV